MSEIMQGNASEFNSSSVNNPVIDVCAAVIRREGRYLLAKRHAGKHLGGKWEFPGGKIHAEETCADCITREMHEELKLAVRNPVFVTLTQFDYTAKTVRLHFMQCDLAPEAKCHPQEHQEVGWFTAGEIQELDLAPADREFAESLPIA